MRIGVIMAGGAGTRFWPYSRHNMPKQLLSLVSPQPLLAETVERISNLISPAHIFVVAGGHLKENILKHVPRISERNIIVEPAPRNTAPCLALAVAATSSMYGDPVMAVLTADHYIGLPEKFLANVEAAMNFAESKPSLITVGVPTARPETGYGYVEAGEVVAQSDLGTIHKVNKFHEKPDSTTAEQYFQKENFFWNSGMFFWRNGSFIETARQKSPEIAEAIERISRAWGTSSQHAVVEETFATLKKISIDFALMEKADNVYMVRADFSWDDIGTWDALERIIEPGDKGNIVTGDAIVLDCSDTIIFNKPVHANSDTRAIVAAIGLKDLVLVNTGDAVLVCPKNRCQDIKKIVEMLKEKHRNEYL